MTLSRSAIQFSTGVFLVYDNSRDTKRLLCGTEQQEEEEQPLYQGTMSDPKTPPSSSTGVGTLRTGKTYKIDDDADRIVDDADVNLVLTMAIKIWNLPHEEKSLRESCSNVDGNVTVNGVVTAILDTVDMKELGLMRKDTAGNTILHFAASEDKVHILKFLLESPLLEPHISELVNAGNENGWTPLHLAASKGFQKIVEKLLKSGANPDQRDKQGALPFHLAAISGKKDAMAAIEAHMKDTDVNTKTEDGRTALHFAVRHKTTPALTWLLSKKAEVDAVDKIGNTPLHYAALNSTRKGTEIVKEIVRHCNKRRLNVSDIVNARNNHGRRPLHFAAREGLLQVSEALLGDGANQNLRDDYDTLPFHLAAIKGKREVLEVLARPATSSHGKTLQAEILQDVNEKTKDGRYALHFAVQKDSFNVDAAKWLLEKNAKVDEQDVRKRSALHSAVILSNVDAVRWLLENKAKVDTQDENGNTPLHDAVLKEGPDKAILELLVKWGAPLCKLNKEKMMPVSYGGKKMIGTLLLLSSSASEAEMQIDVSSQDKNGKNILHYAAEGANNEEMEWLLEKYDVKGKNALKREKEGNTPLHHAANAGNCLTARALLDHIARAMQDANANEVNSEAAPPTAKDLMDAKNNDQMTPILCALRANHTEVSEYLFAQDTSLSLCSINEALYNHIQKTDQRLQAHLETEREACSCCLHTGVHRLLDFLTKRWKVYRGLPGSESQGADTSTEAGKGEVAGNENQRDAGRQGEGHGNQRDAGRQGEGHGNQSQEETKKEASKKEVHVMLPTYLALHACKAQEGDFLHVFKFLLQSGNMQNINLVDEEHHRTCLHWAAFFGRADVASKLLEMNPELQVNAKDKYGKTALQYAVEERHTEVQHELLKRNDVKAYEDRLYRDREVFVDGANAILVVAALIATITFVGWLTPPLNFTSYYDFPVHAAPDHTYESFAAVRQHIGVRVFWACNSLSFFFAMATTLAGAMALLPRPERYIGDVVKDVHRALIWGALLVVFSIMFVLCAFAAAGFVVLPPVLKFQVNMVGTITVGGLLCFALLMIFFQQLHRSLPQCHHTDSSPYILSLATMKIRLSPEKSDQESVHKPSLVEYDIHDDLPRNPLEPFSQVQS